MTFAEWLSTREPPPPPTLAAKLLTLSALTDASGAPLPERLLRASADVLRRLLDDGQTSRGSALELLAADALATYAFEAHGDAPAGLEARCAWAMRHFSDIADAA